ncbi:hypothetical protein V6380_14250 [Acinetobacter variabilis]|uniref:hypothetical protein n=1 Tax=Acinetobacter variabilis TaxID=70346 RepID=UPI003B83F2BE
MIKKKYFWLTPFLVFSLESTANTLPDRPSQVIYSPTVVINPDENSSSFPSSQLVKLLISNEGKVLKVYYPNGTKKEVIQKVDAAMRSASFTPYFKQGNAVQSIVPYVVNFYYLTEEEYRGH